MEKKYKSGLVLGKFLPPHKGHLYLIDTALENSEKVTLLVCSLTTETIPGDYRYNWLKEIYKDEERLTIVNFKKDVPQTPEEDPNFWDIWINIAKSNCPSDLDVIFTSEKYGDPYAEKLGISHYLVDLERKKFPISGTKVRERTISNWEFIPDIIKPFFVKKIAIMGPESVGKSILTNSLSKYFNTNFVSEYGRTLYEEQDGNLSLDDFKKISETRQSMEDEIAKSSNKFLFMDTEDITTYQFSKMFYPKDYIDIEDWFLHRISNRKYDLYIMLKPDCESIQDGTRKFLEERWDHFNSIKSLLIKYNCSYIEIGGSWDNRYNESINYIKRVYHDAA